MVIYRSGTEVDINMFEALYKTLRGLTEGVKDLHKQWVDSGIIDSATFDTLQAIDPTPTKKYLGWMLKQMDREPKYDMQFLANLIGQFHTYTEKGKIENKDIYTYKTLEDVMAAVKEADKKRSRSEVSIEAKEGATIVQRDKKWILIYVERPEAMTYYAMGTQWCISNPDTFVEYVTDQEMCFYVAITKKDITLGEDDEEEDYDAGDKFAITIIPDGSYEIYNATDDDIAGGYLRNPGNLLTKMGEYGLDLSKIVHQDNDWVDDYREEQQQQENEDAYAFNYDDTIDNVRRTLDGIIDDVRAGVMDDYVASEEIMEPVDDEGLRAMATTIVDDELGEEDYFEGPYDPSDDVIIDAMVSLGYIIKATNIDTIKDHIKEFEKTRRTQDYRPGVDRASYNIVDTWINDIDGVVNLEIKDREVLFRMEPAQIVEYMKQLVVKWEEQSARKDVKGQRQMAFASKIRNVMSMIWERNIK